MSTAVIGSSPHGNQSIASTVMSPPTRFDGASPTERLSSSSSSSFIIFMQPLRSRKHYVFGCVRLWVCESVRPDILVNTVCQNKQWREFHFLFAHKTPLKYTRWDTREQDAQGTYCALTILVTDIFWFIDVLIRFFLGGGKRSKVDVTAGGSITVDGSPLRSNLVLSKCWSRKRECLKKMW